MYNLSLAHEKRCEYRMVPVPMEAASATINGRYAVSWRIKHGKAIEHIQMNNQVYIRYLSMNSKVL